MKKFIPQSLKNIYHLFQAILANIWFGFPSRKLKVIGVTGTNGKTTTCQMISKVLEESGHKAAMASTINFKIGKREWVNDTKFTTFSSFGLQKFLRQAADEGCEYAVLEITSHALDQNRVWGVDFLVAVITNITREHLDYHKTMEKYARAKEKLFAMVSKNPKGMSVVNLKVESADNFLKYDVSQKFGYAVEIQNANVKMQDGNAKLKIIIAKNIKTGTGYSQFTIQSLSASEADSLFQINLPGDFNIENALAATCVGLSQGISLRKIFEALGKIKGVPGRLEQIENDRGLTIIVDYAVTPDSLEKLYDYTGKLKKENSRIVAVFGACGERDRGKRPIMGKIVGKAADYVIVTNEDPYNEDPQQIIDEVFDGVINPKSEAPNPKQFQNPNYKKDGFNCWRILDRREAIKKALQIARTGDIVVVTGKGAEETMAIGKLRVPWNDPKVIREILEEQKRGKDQ